MLGAIGTVFIRLSLCVSAHNYVSNASAAVLLGGEEERGVMCELGRRGREQTLGVFGLLALAAPPRWMGAPGGCFLVAVSVLTSSSQRNNLFLLQLELYLGGFLFLLQQGRAGKSVRG